MRKVSFFGCLRLSLLLSLLLSSFFSLALTTEAGASRDGLGDSLTIHSYSQERDRDFIKTLVSSDPYNFPDAEQFSDLDSEKITIKTAMPTGQVLITEMKQSIFVACMNGEPVAFVRSLEMQGGVFLLAQMAVDKPWRRHGVGEKILRYSLEKMTEQGATQIILDTMSQNSAAHALYEKLGFMRTADLASHYLYSKQVEP